MLVLIRGAGDIATGIALRLYRAGMKIIMTELEEPAAIRRTVCFSEAVRKKRASVEGVEAVLAQDYPEAKEMAAEGKVAVVIDEEGGFRKRLCPDILVDAILAKRNLGTRITDAPVVIGVGPGFTAGLDCHAAIETMRGHYLGRVIEEGSPIPNTNIPGLIGGYAGERVLRAPCEGIFLAKHQIGDPVQVGEVAGWVDDTPLYCTLDGMLRGILPDGIYVTEGMKAGDIDPRQEREYCETVSDKALAVGGGVLEAIMNKTGVLKK